MNIIVAVDKNWAIGKCGKLLMSLPSDMKFFKTTTLGNPILMGRKTFESLPKGKPLKDRQNIVLSKTLNTQQDVTVLQSIAALKELNIDKDSIFVIGGANVYKQLLPYCAYAFVTKMDAVFDADTFFPNLDDMAGWEQADIIYAFKEKNIDATIIKYHNTQVRSL